MGLKGLGWFQVPTVRTSAVGVALVAFCFMAGELPVYSKGSLSAVGALIVTPYNTPEST